jgi:prophage tail gpP-like protein
MTSNNILMEINGVAYEGFIDFTVSRSFTTLSGKFLFTAICDPQKPFPIDVNDECTIALNNEPIIDGFIEIIKINYSSSGHQIIAEGRDKTCDIIDSHVGQESFNTPITLQEIIKNCLKTLGITNIKIISNVNITPFDRAIPQACDIGTTWFEFIEKLCRIKQVILTTDGQGNILLDRASIC